MNQDSLARLRSIEEQAAALARDLPPGVPHHRARLIESIAAHLALVLELGGKGGLHDAANDERPESALGER